MTTEANTGLDSLSVELRADFAQFLPPPRQRTPLSQVWKWLQLTRQDVANSFGPPPPAAFDWRSHGVIGAARSQRPWNTCTSFAIAAVLADLTRIRNRPPIVVDPGFIHTCLAHEGRITNSDLDGRTPADLSAALTAIQEKGYALDTGQYPLPASACSTLSSPLRIQGFHAITGTSNTQRTIATEGPVVAEMLFFTNFFDLRGRDCVYVPIADAGVPLLHTVAVIGYDAQGWIIKNSFGPEWGDAGCAKIRYGDCGINTAAGDCRIYDISI